MLSETLYQKIVSGIRDNRTWVNVLDSDRKEEFMVVSGGVLKSEYYRILRLVSLFANNDQKKGQVWNIPEYLLDKAVRLLKSDERFRLRLNNNELLLKDIESIILTATYGILHLELEP